MANHSAHQSVGDMVVIHCTAATVNYKMIHVRISNSNML